VAALGMRWQRAREPWAEGVISIHQECWQGGSICAFPVCICASVQSVFKRPGEMAQRLRALVLAKNPGSIPSTYVAAHDHPLLQFQGLQHPLLTSDGTRQSAWEQNIHTNQFLLGFQLVFFETVSLCRSGHPGTHYVDQAGLKLTKILCFPSAGTKGISYCGCLIKYIFY